MSKRTKNRKGGSEHPCSTRRVRYARGSRARERRRGGGGGERDRPRGTGNGGVGSGAGNLVSSRRYGIRSAFVSRARLSRNLSHVVPARYRPEHALSLSPRRAREREREGENVRMHRSVP